MTVSTTDLRELLERSLPLDRLSPLGGGRLAARVRRELAAAIAEAASAARGKLVGPPAATTPPVEAPEPRAGVLLRSTLPGSARADLEMVRRLLRLDESLLATEPGEGGGRAALIAGLEAAGRELLHGSEVRLWLRGAPAGAEAGPLDDRLARQAAARPEAVLLVEDAWTDPELEGEARGRGIRSLALAGLRDPRGEPLGCLEARSPKPHHFAPEDLALVALLGEHCAVVLQRAEGIERLRFVDQLTGAFNRSYFELQLDNEIARARRENASLAVCIADVDDFKAFNTTYGYEAANRILERVARTLRHGVRPFDTVARWGGEEFAVLLTPPLHLADARAICERLRRAVEQMGAEVEGLDRRRHRVRVTVSMGVALFPGHGSLREELWRAANQALLRAKRPPKNQVEFFGG